MTMVQRWTLATLDNSSSYVFEINPNAQTSPLPAPKIDWSYINFQGDTHGFTGLRKGRQPVEWSFSGVIRSQAQYDALLTWVASKTKLVLTTDLPERLVVRLKGLQLQRKGPQRTNVPWRHTYTVKALVYDYGVPGTVPGVVAAATVTARAGVVAAPSVSLPGVAAAIAATAPGGTVLGVVTATGTLAATTTLLAPGEAGSVALVAATTLTTVAP